MLRVGIIGFGYWGPNLARNVSMAASMELACVADLDQGRRAKAAQLYPSTRVTADAADLINDPSIDLVMVATPSSSHMALAEAALKAGKHVLVEKPIAVSSEQALRLCELAASLGRKLMVDHTFLFTPSVRAMHALVRNKDLGEIYYYDSVRVNLGLIQSDVNVVWDLAPHDLSIVDYLVAPRRIKVSALGGRHVGSTEDLAYVTLMCEHNFIAHFSLSWLSPVKIRRVLLGGSRAMLSWDDTQADEKIKIYNRGIEPKSAEGMQSFMAGYRMGPMYSPHLPLTEALAIEMEHIAACIEQDATPINDGWSSLRILRILEACDLSMRNMGQAVELNLDA